MADFTLIKANPTQGEITSSLTGSTGDGAGLNLANNGYIDIANNAATEFSTTDFTIEFVLNQTSENVSDNYYYFTHTGGNSRMRMWHDISDNNITVGFINSSGTFTDFALDYDVSADYGTPTHYVFAFDRSADLTLYKNGNSVASVNISSVSSINIGAGNANVSRISSTTGYGVLGTFYRFRAFNTLADAKLLFERADVPQTLTANLLFDLDLAFANPSQSLTVQDRKGNTDGTCSASGVTQVQPVVQLNSTSARIGTTAATPADGELLASGNIGSGSANPNIGGWGNAITIDNSGAAALEFAKSGTLYGFVGVQGSGSGNAFDVAAYQSQDMRFRVGSNAGTTAMTIDSSGNVKIGSSSAPDTQLSVECDTTGEAIGDGIRVQNAHGINGDIAPIYFGVHGGTRRAKAAIGLKRTGSYGIGELRFAVDPNSTDTDVSFATDTKLMIDSTGAVTVNETAGSATNSTKLEVRSDADGSTSAIRTTNKDVTAGTNQAAGIDFGLSRNSGAFKPQAGQIKVGRVSDWDASDTNIDSYMAFSTYGNNALGERMRIHSSGGTAGFITVGPIHGGVIFDNTSGTSGATRIQQSYSGSTAELRFGSNVGTTVSSAMNIIAGDAGLVKFNGGIAFSQTNSSATGATATGTTLDHYEEGTWTPVHVTSASTSGTWNTTLTGHYTRVGDLVTVNLKITGTTMDFSSVDGYRGYSGLPFAPALVGCAGSYDSFHAASTKGTCAAFLSGSSLYLYPSKIGTGTTVIFATVTYKV